MNKKIVCIVLALALLTCFVGCQPVTPPVVETLATPANVKISQTGLITWDAVEHATGYVVTVGATEYQVDTNEYQVTNLSKSFRYSVVATADGYNNSEPSETKTFTVKVNPTPTDAVTIGIKGNSEVKSGKSITLKANVTNADNTDVTWKIKKGSEYATIEDGVLTAKEVDGDKTVVVVATSVQDKTVSVEKVINVVSRPQLTQSMLNVFNDQDTIGFEGYVGIDLYVYAPLGGKDNKGELYSTYTTVIKTAMDGEHWYTEYEDGNTGITNSLYYKNHEGLAQQVGLSFMNDEQYFPLTKADGSFVSWEDAGMYNNLQGLRVSDFRFNDDTWRWEYVGADNKLAQRLLASANPYDFTPKGFSLIIGEGEILGVHSVSEDDYSIVEGYVAVQQLFVAINFGEEAGTIPTIAKYSHEDIHDDLAVAISNMQNLTSYTMDFRQTTQSILASGVTEEGFVETITENDCYFQPYTVTYDRNLEEIKHFTKGGEYGYHKVNDKLYNSFYNSPDGYEATRAYEKDFATAKPTFGFAAELFRSYYENEETGETTYYVEDLMSQVATTYYFGVGNDIALYGIFATRGYYSSTESFTPYVTVKDGYITDAGFYFYVGYLSGVVEITYSNFNTVETPDKVDCEVRQVPDSWTQLTIAYSTSETSTEEDVEVNAFGYLNTYFGATKTAVDATLTDKKLTWQSVENATLYLVTVNGKAQIVTETSFTSDDESVVTYSVEAFDKDYASAVPFLVNCLGDTYGFGLTTIRIPVGENVAKNMVVFYYDVPLDIDYTITSSLNAIDAYLKELGFVKGANDVYTKGNICVNPVDSSLDLMVYVWVNNK